MVNKKGFLKTLMTVALALMSVSVFANAPVITDPGDFIVGDLESGAGNNVFVFPDAFDGDAIVSDDTTIDSAIKWSFDDPSGRYQINGVGSIGAGDPNAPGANQINTVDGDTGHPGQDALSNTFTIRNVNLSPGTGLGPYPNPPGGPGVLASETSTITLYASDCSTYSSRTIVLYTADDASDSLSGQKLTNEFDHDYENDPTVRTGWLSQVLPSAAAGTTSSGTTGFCLWVPTNNVAGAEIKWWSPHNQVANNTTPGFVTLTKRNAWRFRMEMMTDQTANNAIPFWTFGYNNLFYQPTLRSNIYGGDLWFLDVAGGANGVNRSIGRDSFDVWATPNSALTLAWNGELPDIGGGPPAENAFSPFAPTVDTRNDMNVSFRILDADAGLGTNSRTGLICMKKLRCDRIAIADMLAGATVLYGSSASSPNPINTATHGVLPDSDPGPAIPATAQIDNANAWVRFLLGPSVESNANTGRKRFIFFNPAGTNIRTRQYPLANSWKTDEVHVVRGAVRSDVGGAGGTTEGTDPLDVIFIDWDTVTNELGGFHFVQKGAPGNMRRAGSPRLLATTAGAPQEYLGVFANNNVTRANPPGFSNIPDRLRGYFDLINNNSLGTTTDGRDPFVITTFDHIIVDTTGY